MRRYAVTLLLTILLSALAPLKSVPAAAPTLPEPSSVPVLLYHHLMVEPFEANGAIVPLAEFQAQMAWLAKHGYQAISTSDLADWLSGTRKLPPKPVLITFDDGYESNYTYGFPILSQYGMKATAFVVGETVGQGGKFPHLLWEHLRHMERSGVFDVQAHSNAAHRRVGNVPVLLLWSQSETERDTANLASTFREHGLQPPDAYAYPFGAYDDRAISGLRAAGIRLAFTVEPGLVQQGDDPYRLKRLVVFPGTTMEDFHRLISGQ